MLPGAPEGTAIDVTAGTRQGWVSVEAREEAKHRKYAEDLLAFPGLAFRAFALDLDGAIGPEAWDLVQRLARDRAARSIDAPVS